MQSITNSLFHSDLLRIYSPASHSQLNLANFYFQSSKMPELLEIGYTDVILLAILVYVVYVMFFKKAPAEPERPVTPPLPDFKMRDMTVQELLKYNGTDDERILLAVAGRVGFLWIIF